MPHKHRLSTSDRRDKPPKRQVREVIVIDDDDEQEESLEHILMRIKQQEDSEALARQLQGQCNDLPGSSCAGSSSSRDFATFESQEDDEALARRLEQEWAQEDAVPTPVAQVAESCSFVSQPSTSSAPATVNNVTDTPNESLKEHFALFTASRPCTKCGAQVKAPRGYVTYATQIPPPSLLVLLHAICQSCETNHCRGCFKVVPCERSCKGKNKDKDCPVMSCCPEIRAIAVFEALGGFDRQYLGERATSDSRSKEAAAVYRANTIDSVGPDGTGYGTGSYSITVNHLGGRGRSNRRKPAPTPTPSNVHSALANHWDDIVVRALSTITMLLPAPYTDDPHVYDMLPHSSITALLQVSQLPEILATLLRNDSVTDWISRDNVYYAMLALLRRMADCELTLDVLIGERYEKRKSGGLEDYVWDDADITWEMAKGKFVKAKPLYVYFQKLTKQCETFLAGASRMLEGSQDVGNGQDADEDVEATIKGASLCGEIIAARDDLERAMNILGRNPSSLSGPSLKALNGEAQVQQKGKNKGEGPDPALEMDRRYRNICEQLAFQHVPFPQQGGNYSTYNYNNELQCTVRSTRNPKDRLHLIKELAVMATSLPTGVWVRVDEVRNDALKIMIAGPEGTPYEGGLFEFDCFLPLAYPHTPPIMHLRTTGGGTVRFNPNLYSCGKVCLSLLGTWQGRPEEQWSPKSTLLQVLVSIQSMILVELPYFNEPGYGKASAAHTGSIEYNKNVSANAVRWAIVEWLKDEHKSSMWADVISSHFIIRAAKIRSCIEKRAKANPRIQSYAPQSHPTHIPPSAYFPAMALANPYNLYQATAPAPQTGKDMDLLRAFDSGMEAVRRWPQTGKP